MDYDTNIVVMGDIHADWSTLNTFMNRKRESQIFLQCGDFGYFPRHKVKSKNPKYPKKSFPKVPKNSKLYFCDGNHEDHESLQKLGEDNEVYPRTLYMRRGRTLTLPDGRVVLFMGGADSIDKDSRTQGFDWFPEENITAKDIYNLDPNMKIDIVISHTCPQEFSMRGIGGKIVDCNRVALSYILNHYRPKLWYFGHWHFYKTDYTRGCRWFALDMTMGIGKWWDYLLN